MTKQSETLVNHEARIRELESHDGEVMKKVSTILEVRLPDIEKTLEKLDTKMSIIAALNIGAIILSKILK